MRGDVSEKRRAEDTENLSTALSLPVRLSSAHVLVEAHTGW